LYARYSLINNKSSKYFLYWTYWLLRRSGRTVEGLAQELDLTNNGIRAHLAVLEGDKIVRQRGSVRRGRSGGKPAHVYGLISEASLPF
jgi:predicted ArsR family transcriptional regulator